MQIISCASYYGSGSSAITDLVSEYLGVKSLSEYEFRFIHDMDGIMDLEYHLVTNHNRHNAGHALKRFLRLSNFNAGTWFNKRYEPFFNGHYLNLSQEYIEALTDCKYPGWWFMDLYDHGKWFYYWKSLEGKIRKRCSFLNDNILPCEMSYCSHPTEERFLALTQDYLHKLFMAANPEKYPRLLVDQLFPSSCINKCLRYFIDDVKVIVVDRDPRDIYFSNLYVWKEYIVPRDVNLFCDWFRYTHESNKGESPNPANVVNIQFEDLIYNYQQEIEKIEHFLNLKDSEHKNPFQNFNPRISIHNTHVWNQYNDMTSVHIIENKLAEYLYDFDAVKDHAIAGK